VKKKSKVSLRSMRSIDGDSSRCLRLSLSACPLLLLRWNVASGDEEGLVAGEMGVDFCSRECVRADENIVDVSVEATEALIVADGVGAVRGCYVTGDRDCVVELGIVNPEVDAAAGVDDTHLIPTGAIDR